MSEYGPSVPSGFDQAKRVSTGRRDCVVTVGLDSTQGQVPRFLVQLHYVTGHDPVVWNSIARIDHNELSSMGHDVYQDGLHVDIDRRTGPVVTRTPTHPPLPASRGQVIRACVTYFGENADWFVDVYEERQSPSNPPHWSPDGGSPHNLFTIDGEASDMSEQESAGETLSPEELSEFLAEITGESAEEIEQGAAEIDIQPPWEADTIEE